ncbi:MAG: DUF5647 family protein [Ignavibacteriales bacterium]|jgi:hypothetical protein
MTKDELFYKNLILDKEFDLYVLEHPEFAGEIPEDAIVVLMSDDDSELAEINLKMAEEIREPEQPMFLVRIKKCNLLLPE